MSEQLNRFAIEAAREGLGAYIAGHWPGLKPARHLETLRAELEAVERGETKRLIINIPPGHGKSETASVGFPAWYLGRNPNRYVIAASHTADLATDFGRKVLGLVGSPLHGAVFPHSRLDENSASASRFNLGRGGAYYSTGIGGTVTGRRAHLLIVDDAAKSPSDYRSPEFRKALKEWFSAVAYTRLMPGGAIVVIASRMHADDLTGWLLREHASDGWRVVSMPAIATADDEWRKEGEPLWPEMFPLPVLASIREFVGRSIWRALYQQDPTSEEGEIFQRAWFGRFREPPASFERVIQSWDTAFSEKSTADFSDCLTIGETRTGYYLLSRWKDQVGFPDLKKNFTRLAEEWKPSAILIEDKASGQSLIQECREATRFPVIAVKVDSDKLTRAHAVSGTVEAGRVHGPEAASWFEDFLDEVCGFPSWIHDDDVDVLTQGLNYLRADPEDGLMGFYRLQMERARRAELEAYWRPRTTSPEELEAAIARELASDAAREEWEKKQRDERDQAEREQSLRLAGLGR